MKKRYYKNLEEICVYFNTKVWNKLFEIANDDIANANMILVKGNKIIAMYEGYVSEYVGITTYNEETDTTEYVIPNRVWKPILESYGFIPKNKKVYFGKYSNKNRKYFLG